MNIADLTNEDILKHRGLVLKIASKYYRQVRDPAIDFDDLMSEANLALARAYERFDPEKGFAFSTFAYKTISGYLQAFLNRAGSQIRFPDNSVQLANRIYRMELEKMPASEIAEAFQIPETRVQQALDYLFLRDTNSLDVPKRDMIQGIDNADSDMYDLIRFEDDLSAVQAAEFMDTLTEKDREILELTMQGYNWRQLGRMYDVSHQAIWHRVRKLKTSYTNFDTEELIG